MTSAGKAPVNARVCVLRRCSSLADEMAGDGQRADKYILQIPYTVLSSIVQSLDADKGWESLGKSMVECVAVWRLCVMPVTSVLPAGDNLTPHLTSSTSRKSASANQLMVTYWPTLLREDVLIQANICSNEIVNEATKNVLVLYFDLTLLWK